MENQESHEEKLRENEGEFHAPSCFVGFLVRERESSVVVVMVPTVLHSAAFSHFACFLWLDDRFAGWLARWLASWSASLPLTHHPTEHVPHWSHSYR